MNSFVGDSDTSHFEFDIDVIFMSRLHRIIAVISLKYNALFGTLLFQSLESSLL